MDKSELTSLIVQKIGEGRSQEDIYSELIASGEGVGSINDAYEAASRKGQPAEVPFGLLNVIFVVGGLSAAIAIVTAVANNWESASVGQQVFSLFMLGVASYGTAYAVDQKTRFPAVATLFYFIGALLLGSSVLALIASSNDDGYYWQLAVASQAIIFGATAFWTKRESMWPFACLFLLIMASGFAADERVGDSVGYSAFGFVIVSLSVFGLVWVAQQLRTQADELSTK